MRWRLMLVVALIFVLLALPSAAQRVKSSRSTLDDLAFAAPETRVVAQQSSLNEMRALKLAAVDQTSAAFDAFLTRTGGNWAMIYDRVSGTPSLIEGRGVSWYKPRAEAASLDGLDATARAFLAANKGLIDTQPGTLELDKDSSGPVGGYLYFLEYKWTYGGVPVDKARVVFRLNHGNMVQFGTENISSSLARLDPRPSISAETALEMVFGYVGGRTAADTLLDGGRILILPVSSPEALSGTPVEPGTGLSYRLVYVITLRRAGVMGTWEALVDAHTGQVLAFEDINEYGSVHGGVYPNDRPAPEADRPMPFADIGGGLYTDAGGIFAGNNATSALNGKYVKISDVGCGPGVISLTTTTGDLNFGMSAGTDCVTPGVGGTGNTHAARTQYYAINLIKMKAMTYMPGNAWLNGQVTDNVNINDVCNAYWNGSSLNFFKSGTYATWVCSNTGEIPGVALHEWGHGMDSNDGNGSSPDNGTGETYGDWSAALQTHNSCGGNGFFIGSNCDGYGNPCTSCTGIRDLDWAKHTDPTPAVPTMLNGSSGFACWLKPSYAGPCGYEGHCESAISSQALWDLSARDLVNPAKPYGLDQNSAWLLADKLWYRSRSTATAAYACPSLATTNGCGVGNLFTVFRVADDDDGDLSNGTPHASAIYDAFNRHAIACTSVNNTDHTSCPAIVAPTLAGASGSMSNSLSWNAVTGASTYDLYRNETGCDAGYTKIYSGATPSYLDNQAIDGMIYYYRVQAIGSNIVCTSLMSNCVALSPATPSGVLTGTVRDAGTSAPIPNAVVGAVSGPKNYSVTTDGSGVYNMPFVAVGNYDMTATVFGYLPGSATGVAVTLGNTTTQDFNLTAAPSYAVSGTVTDANTGWGLYANINITTSGWAGTTIQTNPTTGAYSINLTAGSTYTFTVTSLVPGYSPATASVGPVMGITTQNFGLQPNACGAPGYASAPLVSWDFNAGQPAGWTVQNNGGTCNWVFNNPGARSNLTGGTGSFAVADADNCGSGTTMNTELRTPVQDFSGYPSVMVSFKSDYNNLSSSESADVDVSVNGATGPWTNVWHQNTDQRGPMTVTLDISSIAGGHSNVMVRWHYIAPGWDWWWEVDDVSFLTCAPPPGGLIVGFVKDAGTTLPISGATVNNATTAFTGSSDAAGFYAVYAVAGANSLTASKPTYNTGSATPTGVAHATVRQDFNLGNAAQNTLSGTVKDSATGWPLYASLTLTSSGLPTVNAWTNPVTGAYSALIYAGSTYNVAGTAYLPGYTPLATTAGPIAGDTTQNFTMAASLAPCGAPGYVSGTVTTYSQPFDSSTAPALPAGWTSTVVNGSGAWITRTTTRYPSGGTPHSAPNLVFFNSFSVSTGYSARLAYGTGLDFTTGTYSLSFWMYHDTGYTTSNDRVQVQVSTDGGTTWQNVGSAVSRYTGTTGWAQHQIALTGFTGPLGAVRIGLLGISAYGNDCHVDDLQVSQVACVPPATGGLIVGNVYDANTNLAINGATVNDTTSGKTAASVATPSDPNVDDGFYCLFGSEGSNTMNATATSYGVNNQTPTVPHYGAVKQDFQLPVGRLTATPGELTYGLVTGQTGSQTFDLNNIGGTSVDFTLAEILGHVAIAPVASRPVTLGTAIGEVKLASRTGGSASDVKPSEEDIKLGKTPREKIDTSTLTVHKEFTSQRVEATLGAILLSVDDGVPENAIGLTSGGNVVWLNRFTPAPADMPLYLDKVSFLFGSTIPVGTPFTIVLWEDTDGDGDPGTGSTYLYSQAATVQFNDDATWNDYSITPVNFSGPGDVLVGAVITHAAGQYPASIDETVSQGRSWVGAYSVIPNPPTLPSDSLWGLIDDVGFPGNWTVRASGATGSPDIPWLDENPKTGTLAAGAGQTITVDYDATGLAPGDYLATIQATNNTPYGPLNVPVTLTVWPLLVATATATPVTGVTPLAVTFTGSAAGGDGGPYTYDWNFGDGSPHSTQQNPAHTYNIGGNLTVTLTVTDGHGNTASDSHLVIQVTQSSVPVVYNLYDDQGRARACVNRFTGAFTWMFPAGAPTTTYTGTAKVLNGGTKFTNYTGAEVTLNITIDPLRRKAQGYCIYDGKYSALTDSNIANNPPGCY